MFHIHELLYSFYSTERFTLWLLRYAKLCYKNTTLYCHNKTND